MSPPVLRRGSTGPDVTRWQDYLLSQGYTLGVADGVYGPRTEGATTALQRAHGLDADGVVGPATWAAIWGLQILPPISPWRAQIVAHVEGLVGLAYPDPAYLDAVCASAVDRETRAHGLGQMSGCALVVRAYWAALGVEHPVLAAPYRVGRAVSDVVTVARAAGALRPASSRPVPGDVVVIGGPEHVLTVVGWRGDELVSVDGGQGPGGRAIAERERAWTPGELGGRHVLYVIDADALAASFTSR